MSFKGVKNKYTCEGCKGEIVTIDRDAGVTPFMIDCRLCNAGWAQSSCYRIPQNLSATYEWYAPEDKDTHQMTRATRDHVKNGGLLLRKIEDVG